MITVEVLFKRLSDGENIKKICDEFGIAASTIQRRLKRLGYEWDNSAKVWRWTKEEEQPLSVDLLGQLPGKSNGGNRSNPKITNDDGAFKKDDSSITYDDDKITIGNRKITFSDEELLLLKRIIAEFSSRSSEEGDTLFFRRLRSIGKIETIRKTVTMGEDVGHRLNEFAEKNRVSMSDALTVALLDFFERYDS